jgi:hypothetical protein
LHQLALLTVTILLIWHYRPRTAAPVLRVARYFILANLYMLTAWSVMNLYHGRLPRGPLEQSMYLLAFVAVGTYVYRAAADQEKGATELLRWAAAAAVITLITALTLSMLANGVQPLQVFTQSVATADPRVLQDGLFKSSFQGFGSDEAVRGNLRHEVFGSILVAMYISAWASGMRPFATTGQRLAYRASMITGSILLALSLSRSILIAALLWPLLIFLRSVLTLRLSTRQVAGAITASLALALMLGSGFGQVFWNRFTEDTGSYNARSATLSQAPARVMEHFFTGGADTAGSSSHNFILDAWLRGGVFTALPAIAVVLLVAGTWIALVVRMHREPDWMLPVTAAMALPLVRFATQGGGLIGVGEWVCLAFVAGALTYRQLAHSRATSQGRLLQFSRTL